MTDARVTQIGQEAVAADRELRRQRTLRDKAACAAYELATGKPLPEVVRFEDSDGSVYEISIHAEIRLVEKGAQE